MFPEQEFFNQRTLLIGLEIVEGQAVSLNAGTHAFQMFEGKAGTEHDKSERKRDKAFFTGHKFKSTNRRRYIEGGFEITPPAAPGDPGSVLSAEPMLVVGGMARSDATGITRLNPISREIPTACAHWFHGGRFTEVTGARAAISGLSMKVGERFMAQARLQGSFTNVAEEDLPNADYTDFPEPVVIEAENSTFSVNGIQALGKELTVDFGSDLKSKQWMGLRRHRISDRVATYKMVFAPPPLAEFDPWQMQKDGTEFVAFAAVREDDGRVSVLPVRCQIDGISESDVEMDYHYELSGPCIATDTGGDEFWLAFAAALELTGTLDPGTEGVAYSDGLGLSDTVFVTSLGAGSWSIEDGTLPPGLTLASATGLITGTPTAAGTFEFTVQHRDVVGRIAIEEVELVIAAP